MVTCCTSCWKKEDKELANIAENFLFIFIWIKDHICPGSLSQGLDLPLKFFWDQICPWSIQDGSNLPLYPTWTVNSSYMSRDWTPHHLLPPSHNSLSLQILPPPSLPHSPYLHGSTTPSPSPLRLHGSIYSTKIFFLFFLISHKSISVPTHSSLLTCSPFSTLSAITSHKSQMSPLLRLIPTPFIYFHCLTLI